MKGGRDKEKQAKKEGDSKLERKGGKNGKEERVRKRECREREKITTKN